MKNYALIGRRLTHSFSQRYFEVLFQRIHLTDHRYILAEMDSVDGLRQWVKANGIAGFNVTVPYKQAVLTQLDSLDPDAASIGAVNCVTVEKGGLLVGHNTDAPAFLRTLDELPPVHEAVVLGTGGAARAVGYALTEKGLYHRYVSRTPEEPHALDADVVGYETLAAHPLRPSTLIVNATPVGMFPNSGSSPWPQPQLLRADTVVYDLIYNPTPTLFMQQAREHGATATDGLRMLHLQADLSWQLWQQ